MFPMFTMEQWVEHKDDYEALQKTPEADLRVQQLLRVLSLRSKCFLVKLAWGVAKLEDHETIITEGHVNRALKYLLDGQEVGAYTYHSKAAEELFQQDLCRAYMTGTPLPKRRSW